MLAASNILDACLSTSTPRPSLRLGTRTSDDEKILDENPGAPPAAVQRASAAINSPSGIQFAICEKEGRNLKVTDLARVIDVDRRALARREKSSVLYVSSIQLKLSI